MSSKHKLPRDKSGSALLPGEVTLFDAGRCSMVRKISLLGGRAGYRFLLPDVGGIPNRPEGV